MSPEQVEAKPVDGRSDIFSFGCILYEAVTRRKPFTADSNVDLLHQILHDDPEPISDLTPEVPWELRRIVRRCLAKNPDKRYQSMKDLANELRDLVDDYDQLTPGSGARPLSDDSRQRKGRPGKRSDRRGAADRGAPCGRSRKGEPSRLTHFDGGYIGDFHWSRDGADLYVTRGALLADMVMISNFR